VSAPVQFAAVAIDALRSGLAAEVARCVAWHASLHAQHAGAREGKLRGGSSASSVALFAAVAAFILGVVVALFFVPRV
jgi:hypothetical protein